MSEKLIISLSKLDINAHTDALKIQSGFIILKLNDKKVENVQLNDEIEKNIEEEMKKIILIKQNNQLNQFSNIYFEKIKKDKIINEL